MRCRSVGGVLAIAASTMLALLGGCVFSFGDLQGGCADCDAADAGARDDASDASDGGPDAFPGKRFCEVFSNGLFCDDFDDKPLDQTWTTSEPVAGGVLVLDGTSPESPPRALLAAASDGQAAAVLENLAGSGKKHHHLSFSLRIEARTGTAGIFTFRPAGGGSPFVRMSIGGGGADHTFVEEGFPGDGGAISWSPHQAAEIPASNVWVRVSADIDLETRKFQLKYGRDVVLGFTLDPSFHAGSAQLQLGILYTDSTDGWRLRVDDVLYLAD